MRIGTIVLFTVFIAQTVLNGQDSSGDTTEIIARDSSAHATIAEDSIPSQSVADTSGDQEVAAQEEKPDSISPIDMKTQTVAPEDSAEAQETPDTLLQKETAKIPQNNDTAASDGPELFEEDQVVLDLQLNLSLGISLTEFKLPEDASTQMKPRFLLDVGVVIPFLKWFYAGVSLKYLQLSVGLSKSYSTFPNDYPVVTGTIKTEEKLTYVSAAVKCGMRFELETILPYFYIGIEPAYLTAAGQYTVENTHTLWDVNGPEQFDKIQTDNRVTRQRERHQIFAGGGIGLEIFYGYGSIIIDGGLLYGLFDNDESNDTKSVFKRTSCRIFYFPVSLGIRFYL